MQNEGFVERIWGSPQPLANILKVMPYTSLVIPGSTMSILRTRSIILFLVGISWTRSSEFVKI